MAQRHTVTGRLIFALALLSLAGCSSVSTMLDPGRLDYKSASKQESSFSLEVPPDLTQLQRENRYAISELNNGKATASGYNLQQSTRPALSAAISVVAPKVVQEMRIDREGNQRWLVVKQSPEILWPQLKDFWQDLGFLLSIELPEAGVMETDWAENRAKIPQDVLRTTLGKALDSFYSTGERDKFRTRLERTADGSTEIFISHRGAQEVLTGQQNDGSVWTPRASDPELEAEFLSRLMTRLGLESSQAKAKIASSPPIQSRAKLQKSPLGAYVEVDESFDRVWRRVGLALDRVGFTVEDRDRTQGLYFVRYVDQGLDAQNKSAAEKSFFDKLLSFGSNSEKSKSAQRYRITVKSAGVASQVGVQNIDGKPEVSATADRILALLNEQLK